MLKYKQIESKNGLLVYQYRPEGNGEPGIVSIDTKTGEAKVSDVSNDDIGNRYAHKLMKKLLEFYNEGNYKESGTVAWY